MGVATGLEADGPVGPGVDGALGSSPSCWRNWAS